ncbi:MAG: hypothetical protein IPL12_18150 [Bacteroidetes bacterium]|nr:hypothetical protein [Bacteroidota bacterium]
MKTIKNFKNQFFANLTLKNGFNPKTISLVLLLLMTFYSCSKYEYLSDNVASSESIGLKGVELVDGHLTFTDEIAFQETIDYLKNHQDDISTFYNVFPGFISADAQYRLDLENFDINVKDVGEISKFKSMSLRTINNETEIVPTVDAVLLGYIANSDHVFQIGDFLYYVTYESTYEIPMKFVTSTKIGVVFEVSNASKIYPIERSIGNKNLDEGSRAITDEFTYNYYTCSIDRRFYGNMETTDVGVYLEIRLTTKHQKKSLGIWVGEKVSYIGTTGIGKYTGPFAEDPTQYDYNVTVNKYDENDANKVISGLGGLGGGDHYYFVAGECDNTHKFNKDCSGALYTNYTNY